MRAIKFRVFDRRTRKTYFPTEENELFLSIGDSGYFEVQDHSQTIDYKTLVNALDNDIVLMQFTGLTDNNGKDIFESDILVDSVGRNWVVKYNNKMAAFMAHFIDSEGNTNQFQHFERFTSTQKPLEVIGNIHENPELIK